MNDAIMRAVMAVGALAVAAVAAFFATPFVPESVTLLLFLAAVGFAAIAASLTVALACAAAATCLYTLLAGQIPDHPYVLHAASGGVALGGIAIALGLYSEKAHDRAAEAGQRATDMAALYHLSRRLVGATSIGEAAAIIVETGERLLGCRTLLMVKPDVDDVDDAPDSVTVYPADVSLSAREREAARAAMEEEAATCRQRDAFADVRHLFMPLSAGDQVFGIIGFLPGEDDDAQTFKDGLAAYRLTGAFVDLASLALAERVLTRTVSETTEEAEKQSRRTDVLISLAHDLNSPLASIVGASSSLLQYDSYFDRITRLDLVETIHDEAQRLSRFVRNLLALTKLDDADTAPQKDWIEVTDLIVSAVRRMEKTVRNRHVTTNIPAHLPLLRADVVLLEQALTNLLENAAKYSAPDDPIWVDADVHDGHLRIRVRDEGIGLSRDDPERIFERFYRARKRDHTPSGSGLGLNIARAVVEAHGGTLKAASDGLGHGSTFTIMLPVPRQPAALDAEAAS